MQIGAAIDLSHRRTPPPVDLNDCDREPIHIPGFIQPHGILVSFKGVELRTSSVSHNVEKLLGQDARAFLGVPLSRLIDHQSLTAVEGVLGSSASVSPGLTRVRLNGATGPPWRALVHTSPTGNILEALLPQPQVEAGVADLFERFDNATRRLQATTELKAICACLAQEIRALTGYGRVKVYRFASDWSGEVIAEDRSAEIPSFLDLHFPASDIPVQARALYALNPERQIPDVCYAAVPLVSLDGSQTDLSQAVLRSVSPIHIEYLRNMQVGASMSVSILRKGELWGLVACHHPEAHFVAPEMRQASLLLTQLAAWQLTLCEETEIAHRSVRVKALETMLLRESMLGVGHFDEVLSSSTELLDLLEASGLVLCHGGTITTLGDTPEEKEIRPLLDWLATKGTGLFETDRLASLYPPAAALQRNASGIVAVSLGGAPTDLMVWFRPEFSRTVTWSGDPTKPIDPVNGRIRLTPRQSFDAWTEEVRGRSRPWLRHEVAAANGLRDVVVDIILRHAAELEQLNLRLLRSNEDLEAFAYVASHDLKEPLRQIQTFGTLLDRAFRDQAADAGDTARWLDGIQTTSIRLRTLVNDLVEYSRLGRDARPFSPTSLTDLFESVKADFAALIEASAARFDIPTTLPIVMGDPTQLRQVVQNVISNALKYRHADRAPLIRVSATSHPASSDSALPHLAVLDIAIADNGLGLEERHRAQIFEPFQRLHSADDYEGSGIGLAICRKIMTRHHGSIDVVSQVGHGSTFTVSLPQRPLILDPVA